MSRQSWPILLTLCVLSLLPARADDALVAVTPQPGVVLLRNGQALSGKITQAGDEYYVALPSGEIRLQAHQVELVCRNLQEGYERKRAWIDPDKVGEHLDLALWCVRQRLYQEANQELGEARALDRRHPRIALVERQLKLAQEQPPRTQLKTGGNDAGPSTEDLDRLMRGMPHGTVETFANTIQPLLMNTCASAGCHGPQAEGKLRLLRTQLGKTSSRRFTQRNLHAVMEMIDRADPPSSPLLTAPVGPHGTAKAAIFTNKEVVQYRQLVNWVMRVSQGAVGDQPSSVERPDDHLLQQLPRSGRAKPQQPAPNPLLVGREEASSAMPAAETPAARSGRSVDKKTPRKAPPPLADPPGDPFDPAVFNEQFAPPD
jgi:hypothetical protein